MPYAGLIAANVAVWLWALAALRDHPLLLGTAAIAFAPRERFDAFREIGGTIGTAVSATFLLVFGCMNLVILRDVWRRYRGTPDHAHAAAHAHRPAGLVARLLRPLFRCVSKSWQLYPVGVLFGLGCDTATETALLAVAATQASHALPVHAVMCFPRCSRPT